MRAQRIMTAGGADDGSPQPWPARRPPAPGPGTEGPAPACEREPSASDRRHRPPRLQERGVVQARSRLLAPHRKLPDPRDLLVDGALLGPLGDAVAGGLLAEGAGAQSCPQIRFLLGEQT